MTVTVRRSGLRMLMFLFAAYFCGFGALVAQETGEGIEVPPVVVDHVPGGALGAILTYIAIHRKRIFGLVERVGGVPAISEIEVIQRRVDLIDRELSHRIARLETRIDREHPYSPVVPTDYSSVDAGPFFARKPATPKGDDDDVVL